MISLHEQAVCLVGTGRGDRTKQKQKMWKSKGKRVPGRDISGILSEHFIYMVIYILRKTFFSLCKGGFVTANSSIIKAQHKRRGRTLTESIGIYIMLGNEKLYLLGGSSCCLHRCTQFLGTLWPRRFLRGIGGVYTYYDSYFTICWYPSILKGTPLGLI